MSRLLSPLSYGPLTFEQYTLPGNQRQATIAADWTQAVSATESQRHRGFKKGIVSVPLWLRGKMGNLGRSRRSRRARIAVEFAKSETGSACPHP